MKNYSQTAGPLSRPVL